MDVMVKIRDYLRGRADEEITVRFNPANVATLSCGCDYEGSAGDKTVVILKKMEFLELNGSWAPYPAVTWLDGAEGDEQLITRAFVRKDDGEFYIMTSPDGVPDGRLMTSAQKEGIYTETLG